MGDPIVDLGLSCPKAGRFYICEDQPTRFMGCCTIDPCATADGLCPDGDLQPASFSSDAYSKILAQDCLDPGFLWYTCRDSSPPFLGCCSQMACESAGCPASKVGAASLAGNKQQAAPFLSGGSASSRASSSSSSKTTGSAWAPSTTLSTVLSAAASTTRGIPKDTASGTAPDEPRGRPSLSAGGIAGVAIGAIIAGCLVGLLCYYTCWRCCFREKLSSPADAAAVDDSGRKDGDGGSESLAEHRDGAQPGAGAAGAAEQMPQAEPSPGIQSAISELPATPSQHSITSGATPARPIVSIVSASGVTGRESDASGGTAPSATQSPQLKQKPSPLMHQMVFELEDSSAEAK